MKILTFFFNILLLLSHSNSARMSTQCALAAFFYMGSYQNIEYWLCHVQYSISVYSGLGNPEYSLTLNNIKSIRGYVLDSTNFLFIDQNTLSTDYYYNNIRFNSHPPQNILSCSGYKSSIYCLILSNSKLQIVKIRKRSTTYADTIEPLSNMVYPSSIEILIKPYNDEKYLICYIKQSKTYCGFEYSNVNDAYHYPIKYSFTKLQYLHLEEDESLLIAGLTMESSNEINVVVLVNHKWEVSVVWNNDNPANKHDELFISNGIRNVNKIFYRFVENTEQFLDYYEMYRCYNIDYGSQSTPIAFTLNRIILANDDTIAYPFYFDDIAANNLLMIDGVTVQRSIRYTTDKELTVASIQSITTELRYLYHIANSKEICSITIVQCIINCASCWGKGTLTDHKCYFCNTGYKQGAKEGNCEKETNNDYYFNTLENVMDRCPSDCNTCDKDPNDDTIVKCLTCKPAKPYITDDGNCLAKCPNGLPTSSNQCIRLCPGPGDQVMNEGGRCSNCIAPKDKYYEEACYDKCPINTYAYLYKCHMKCPIGTTLNIIERTCTPCSSQTPLTLYSKHKCLSSCQEGYVLDPNNKICKKCSAFYHNNVCVSQCPLMSSSIALLNWDNMSSICNECRGFYDIKVRGQSPGECVYKCIADYNAFNQCATKVLITPIDSSYIIQLNHNPLPEQEPMIKNSFLNLSKSQQEVIVSDLYEMIMEHNNDMSHYEELLDKITYIELYYQLVSLSSLIENNDQQSKRANDVNKKLLLILNSKEGKSIVYDIRDTMAIISLSILYSTLNSKIKVNADSYQILSELISVFFNEHYKNFLLPNNQDKLKQGAKEDYISDLFTGMANAMSKQIDMVYNKLPKSSLNQSQITVPRYQIENAILTTDQHIKFKTLLDSIAEYSMRHVNWLSINTPNYLIKNSPIDLSTSTKWFVQSDCSSTDHQSTISQMKTDKIKRLICLPSNIASSNPLLENGNLGIIDYKLYPLVNSQLEVVTKDFVSLRLFSKEHTLIPIKGISEPITIIMHQSNVSYNECIFYNEETKTLNNTDCTSLNIDEYLICSCTHLTDFGGSIFNPVNVFNDVVKLFKQSRFITSFEAFKYLNAENATVIYVFSGVVFLYLIGLVITMKYDMKNEDDCFIIIVDKTPKCCSNSEIEEEIEILRTKTVTQIMERKNVIVHKFLGGTGKKKLNLAILSNLKIAIEEPPQENIKPETWPSNMSQVINNNVSEDMSNESINNNSVSTSSLRRSDIQGTPKSESQPISQPLSQPSSLSNSLPNSRTNTPNNASAPPQVIPPSSASSASGSGSGSVSVSVSISSSKLSEENKHLNKHCFLRYIYLFKEFFLNEYRVCLLILNKEHVYTRSNVLTLITVKLIAMLTICAIFTQCKPIGLEDEEGDDGFTSRMLAVGIGTILLLEIPFTFCEVFLLKEKLPLNKKKEK